MSIEESKRIVIFGLPGAGKMTFARKLALALDLPIHHREWNHGIDGAICASGRRDLF